MTAEDEQRERVQLTEMAASVGIAKADAQRFLDRLKELEPILQPMFDAMEKSLTGTQEEKRKQMDAFAKTELGKIAVEMLGEKRGALVEKMVRSGVHGVSLDSPDVGVDLAAVAKGLPEGIVAIGNVNPATTMRFGSPTEVRRQVDQLLKSMESFPNFILSTGCDLPQETPVENIRVFMEAGRAWKRR